MRFISINTR